MVSSFAALALLSHVVAGQSVLGGDIVMITNSPSSRQFLGAEFHNQTRQGVALHQSAQDEDTFHIFGRCVFAVAQTLSMAVVGLIFRRLGVITPPVRKALSSVSMNIMIPSLLFSSMMNCPQGGPTQDRSLCPDLETSIGFAWPLFLLPILWVTIGAVCGLLAALASRTSRDLWGTMMAGCGFANATGLPITLLTAFAGSDEQRLRNYLLLVSIYQVLFPMINWTVGRKLLSKKEEDEDELRSGLHTSPSGVHTDLANHQQENPAMPDKTVTRAPKESWGQFLRQLVSSALVPPVIAILCSFTICMLHIHGYPFLKELFVDTDDFENDHALEWLFDAIKTLGKAAVPLNMLVLGSGLGNIPNFSSIPWPSTIALVFAKLVVHPALGFGLVFSAVKSGFIAEIPDQLHAKDDLVLVALIMCSCPTSPSLALMAELYGGPQAKNFLSGAIFLMYCCAPIVLTAWLVLFVSFSEMVPV